MLAPAIYRSTDTNAPVLFGGPGSLITLLDAILVNGYGSAFATGTITSDGTNVVAGDTVTVGSITYTFQTSLTAQPSNTLLIGASATNSMDRLRAAISGIGAVGTDYSTGTVPHPDVWAGALVGLICPITARKGGSTGNAIALSRASAGTPHISVSGATLTGGGGSDTKASAGWTKAYGTFPQAAYRQPAGCRFYLQVDDSGPGSGGAREARCTGWEAMTAYNLGSGQFPTPAQVASGAVCRKSTSLDSVARAWIAFVDDRTFYLFTLTADAGGNYHGFSFGDFYSVVPGDAYKCLIMSGSAESSSSQVISYFGQQVPQPVSGNALVGHWLSRNYAGFGGSTNFVKVSDSGLTPNTTVIAGNLGFPNSGDGGIYLAPFRIIDGSAPGGTVVGSLNLRGRIRGLYQLCHVLTAFNDGDTFNGSGDYAGRSFSVVKFVFSNSNNNAFAAMETTPWEVSA